MQDRCVQSDEYFIIGTKDGEQHVLLPPEGIEKPVGDLISPDLREAAEEATNGE